MDLFHIPHHIHQNLKSVVNDYIVNNQWSLPGSLQALFPYFLHQISNAVIRINFKVDQFIWKHSTSGDLSLKDAYSFSLLLVIRRNGPKSFGMPIFHPLNHLWFGDSFTKKCLQMRTYILEVARCPLDVVYTTRKQKLLITCSSNAHFLLLYGIGSNLSFTVQLIFLLFCRHLKFQIKDGVLNAEQ